MPSMHMRLKEDEDEDDTLDWNDDVLIEMMLSGVDVSDQMDTTGNFKGLRLIQDLDSEKDKAGSGGKEKEISKATNKTEYDEMAKSKIVDIKKGRVKGAELESEKKAISKRLTALEYHKAMLYRSSSVEDDKFAVKRNVTMKLGRPVRITSDEEFPFPIPELSTPRQNISIDDIFKPDSTQTINNFLFEAAIQRCKSPNHVQNLVSGLSFYQKKWFELGNNDLTSFLGDLGVLYSKEARQLLEQQMALMKVDFEGAILLRYVDPMRLNFDGINKKTMKVKGASRKIQIFFDTWEQIKQTEAAQLRTRDTFPGKMEVDDDQIQENNSGQIKSRQNLKKSPVSGIDLDAKSETKIDNKMRLNPANQHSDNRYFKPSAKVEFELILKAIDRTGEKLSLIEQREESDSYQNIFKDEELESLLGVSFNKSQNYKLDDRMDSDLERYDHRNLMVDGLRGKITDFQGFSSKYKGVKAAFLRNYTKEMRDVEGEMFEKKKLVLLDSAEDQMLRTPESKLDSDEQIYADVFERKQMLKSQNSKHSLKERLLKTPFELKKDFLKSGQNGVNSKRKRR